MIHRTAWVYTWIALMAGCTTRLCDDHFSTSGKYTVQVLDIEREGGPFKYNPIWTAAYVDSTGSCSGLDGLDANAPCN